jgi:hypothetical protein
LHINLHVVLNVWDVLFNLMISSALPKYTSATMRCHTRPGRITSIKKEKSWVWWYMPVIPALGRLRQKD